MWKEQKSGHAGFVVSKTTNIQRLSKIFSAYFQRLFKEGNQLSENCERKHHFCPVISPATSHLKMYLFIDICENLALQSIYFISYRKSHDQIITKELILKTFKDFLRFFTHFKDFSKTLKTCIQIQRLSRISKTATNPATRRVCFRYCFRHMI